MVERKEQKDDLELSEDFTFEQREWKVQRLGWLIMALTVALALLGLFGLGPLSSRTLISSDGVLRLEYDRFARHHSSSTLRLQFAPTGQTKARLWISRQFMENMKLESIVPAPERVEMRDGGQLYTFAVPRGESTTAIFYLQTEKMGANPLQLRLNEGSMLQAPYWVYP